MRYRIVINRKERRDMNSEVLSYTAELTVSLLTVYGEYVELHSEHSYSAKETKALVERLKAKYESTEEMTYRLVVSEKVETETAYAL